MPSGWIRAILYNRDKRRDRRIRRFDESHREPQHRYIVQYTTEEHSMQLESTGGMGADLFVRTKVKEVVAQSDAGTLIPRGVRNNLK